MLERNLGGIILREKRRGDWAPKNPCFFYSFLDKNYFSEFHILEKQEVFLTESFVLAVIF